MKDFKPAQIKPTISFRRSFVKEIRSADILSASGRSPLNACRKLLLAEGSHCALRRTGCPRSGINSLVLDESRGSD